MRLRRVAWPILRPATNPNRGLLPSPGARQTPKCGVWSLFPRAWALRYSRRRRTRASLVKRAFRGGAGEAPGGSAWPGGSGARFSGAPCLSHCEAFPFFGSAALQNPAAAFGAHAAQETVGASPLQSTGLIRPFHRIVSLGHILATNFL